MTEVKRVRRKKQFPAFWNEKTEGERYINFEISDGGSSNSGTEYKVSPYTDFIPILYLTQEPGSIFDYHYSKSYLSREGVPTKYLKKIEEQNPIPNYIGRYLADYGWNKGIIEDLKIDLKSCINDYLFNDNCYSLIWDSVWGGSGSQNAINNLKSNKLKNLYMRSYQGYIGGLSVFLGRDETNPHILAVIEPEDLIYQKLHLLLHGTLDMEKVIILIDRQLDATDFPNKAFRAFYKKYILPELAKYKCNIWKVPLDFIKESCFHKKISIKETNILKRKQLIKSLIEQFKTNHVQKPIIDEVLKPVEGYVITTSIADAINPWATTIITDQVHADIPF